MQTATRQAILNHLLRSINYAKPTYYLSWAEKSDETLVISEIGGAGYARQLLVTDDASWSFNATTKELDNAILLSYSFQEEWLTLDTWGDPDLRQTSHLDLYSALTGGDLLWRIPLIFTYGVGNDGTSVAFQIGDFNIAFTFTEPTS